MMSLDPEGVLVRLVTDESGSEPPVSRRGLRDALS